MVSKNAEFKQGHSPLTDQDKAILDFAKRNYKYSGQRDSDAQKELGLTGPQYNQRLNDLLDHPGALEYAPMVVSRLSRIRAKKIQERNRYGN